jgi:uncharacterized membrane protein
MPLPSTVRDTSSSTSSHSSAEELLSGDASRNATPPAPSPAASSFKTGRYHLGLLRKSEYDVGDLVPFSSVFECLESGEMKAFRKGELFTIPDERELLPADLNPSDVTWVPTDNIIEFITKNLNVEYDKIETVELRVADSIANFAGSMKFFYFHVLWFSLWVLMNRGVFGGSYIFDPYPFGLLTMIVSLEAIFLSTFIMISQNVQSKRSELRAELDYQTNLKAEKGVAEVLALLKEMKEEEFADTSKARVTSRRHASSNSSSTSRSSRSRTRKL